MNTPPPTLLRAYQAAEYHLYLGQELLVFYIDKAQPELDSLLQSYGVSSAAFITAYNPRSQLLDEQSNLAAQAQLETILFAQSLAYLSGCGVDPKGIWPPEPSFMIFGLTQESARLLGQQFQQNAIVWIEAEKAPRLLFI